MARAFKCDKCGEYEDGHATQYDVSREYRTRCFREHVVEEAHDLCEECSEEFEGMVFEFFGIAGDDEDEEPEPEDNVEDGPRLNYAYEKLSERDNTSGLGGIR